MNLTPSPRPKLQLNPRSSLGHQLLLILKSVFRVEHSRHQAKLRGDDGAYIFGISTMQDYTAIAFRFARYLKEKHQCRTPADITPAMCEQFVQQKLRGKCRGGTLGKYQAALRKIDKAMRALHLKPADAPEWLPPLERGGKRGFHASTSTEAYTPEESKSILEFITEHGSRKYAAVVVLVIRLMIASGLRISEALYLKGGDIDIETRRISLNHDGAHPNRNHAKGGRSRVTMEFGEEDLPLMRELCERARQNSTGYIFDNRRSLANHVREDIRRACRALNIEPLGSHAFRKRNAQDLHAKLMSEGVSDQAARVQVSRHLGHNRLRVINESYVPPQDRRN